MLECSEDRGSWRISLAGEPFLNAKVLLRDDAGDICLARRGNGRFQGRGVTLDTHFRAVDGALEAVLNLRVNDGRHVAFAGLDLGPLNLGEKHRFFGATSGFFGNRGVVPALSVRDEGHAAAMLGVVSDPDGVSILAGIGAPGPEISAFSLAGDSFRAGFKPGRTLAGSHEFRLFISAGSNPLELLAGFADFLSPGGRCGRAAPTGWNSWDFYGGAIRMKDMEKEMLALGKLPFREALEYLVLDFGWEETLGDWRPNRNFPRDLKNIAERIRAGGWRPGIWVAPFQVSMFTPLARNRPELFLRNKDGGLIIEEDAPCGPVLLLDFSLAEARKLVEGWFSAMRKAGFDLFKIDYVYEKYLDHSANNAGGLGRNAFAGSLFQTVREAVGEEAHIINCGGSKEACLGLVDSVRVSTDIHNFWGHIRNNARQLACSSWMNRRLWINDPDFAIIRHRGNCTAKHKNMPYTRLPLVSASDFWMRGPEASYEELRLWLSVVRLNGGSLFLSDSIQALSTGGKSDLGRLFPPLESSFTPLDLFEREWPGIWLSHDSQRPTLGIMNWEDTRREIALPASLAGLTGRDFWSGRPVRLAGSVELDARSGFLLEI